MLQGLKKEKKHFMWIILFSSLLQYGPVFSFTMVGKTFTYLLGSDAATLMFNSKNDDLNAEDVYSKLTTPVFGKGVAYDVPNPVSVLTSSHGCFPGKVSNSCSVSQLAPVSSNILFSFSSVCCRSFWNKKRCWKPDWTLLVSRSMWS